MYLGNVVAVNEMKAKEVPYRTALVPGFQRLTPSSFQVVVIVSFEFRPAFRSSGIRGFETKLLRYARKCLGFDWMAVTGARSGMTPAGATGWRSLDKMEVKHAGFRHHGSAMSADVSTASAGLPAMWKKVSAAV